jgi:ComF family protein
VSILPQPLAATLDHLAGILLPGSCLLCGADAGRGLICAGCRADLPPAPSPACPQCGEATTHGERCGACLKDPPAFARTVALFRYEFPVDRIIHALKYAHRLPVAAWLGDRLAAALADDPPELVVPLPLHPERLRERGFNQSAEIARALARRLARPLEIHAVERTRATPPQAGLPLKERSGNVRGAFECCSDLGGRSVLLVDDVMTSGATLRECARVLRLHGAGPITVAVAARALRQ